jgi:pseudaminic acid cytidylyltransferase
LYPRPSNLSDDYTTIINVIKFEIKNLEYQKIKFNNICCIFPAAPFLKVKHLLRGFKVLKKKNFKGFVFGADELPKSNLRSFYFQKNKLNLIKSNFKNTRTQDLPKTYVDAGQFYWGSKKLWKKENNVFIKDSNILLLPRSEVFDIDNFSDLKAARRHAKKLKKIK